MLAGLSALRDFAVADRYRVPIQVLPMCLQNLLHGIDVLGRDSERTGRVALHLPPFSLKQSASLTLSTR